MASKEELYVSVSPEEYKLAKLNILTSQADLLTTLKHMHSLKVLARQKHDLKIRLSRLFEKVLSDVDSIKEKMPLPKLPKSVQKEIEPEIFAEKTKTDSVKHDEIDKELKAIQEKLRELNV